MANRIAFFMAPMPWNTRASPTNGYAPGSYLPKPGGGALCAPPPGFGKYEPGAYPLVGLARVFHGNGATK